MALVSIILSGNHDVTPLNKRGILSDDMTVVWTLCVAGGPSYLSPGLPVLQTASFQRWWPLSWQAGVGGNLAVASGKKNSHTMFLSPSHDGVLVMKLWVCQLTWSLCVSPDTYIPHRVEKPYLPSGKGLNIM